jgi:Chloroplast envelope transporter
MLASRRHDSYIRVGFLPVRGGIAFIGRGDDVNPSPFSRPRPERRTLVQRLFRRTTSRNAIVDLIALFDAAGSPRDLTPADVAGIATRHGVNLQTGFRSDLERMYREFIVHCLMDRRLSADEIADIEHLRLLFGLDGATCDAIQRNVARQIYLKSVGEVLADGTIDEGERTFLAQLREQLAIPEAVAENIVEVKRRQYESRYRQPN